MIDTIGEARRHLQKHAKFGDEKSILARDLLRLADDLNGLEVTCYVCDGSGIAAVDEEEHLDDFDDYEDVPVGECKRCRGRGIMLLQCDEDTDRVTLYEWKALAEADGLL